MNTKPVRINYSQETLELLNSFATFEGHGSLSAALATVVKFGVPYLTAQRLGQVQVVQQQGTPEQVSALISSFVEPETTQEMSDTIEQDATIARLSLLLEEF